MQHSSLTLRNRNFALGALSALGLLLASAPVSAATLAAAAAADLQLTVAAEGLAQPTDVTVLPDGRIVITQRTGTVSTFTPNMPDPAEDHIMVQSGQGEQGLLGVIADPNFATNQYIYFYASAGADAANRHQVQRYKLGADGKLTDKKVVIDMGLMGPANHNGGALDIYDGNLFIGVGDTGANSSPPTNHFGSCLNHANGKVLRVSLAEATLGQPPADNPLMNQAMVTGCMSTGSDFGMFAPEKRIYGWGFRNPFRLWVDRSTGKVWVGDVGEVTREEITVASMGKHHGYPFFEGTKEWDQSFKPPNACMGEIPASECIPPVFDYGNNGGGAVIGGRILDGCGWPAAWKARYVFGDHEQRKVWSLDVNATRDGVVANSLKDFASTQGVAALRMGTDNALYIVEEGNGSVSRVTAKNSTTTPNSCPTVNGPGGVVGGGGSGSGGATAGGGAGSGGTGTTNGGAAGSATSAGAATSAGGTNTNPAAGGSASTTGGTASSSAGATSASPGAGAGGASAGDDTSGCGCRMAGGAGGSALGLGALSFALGLALQRRRRVRRS
jgi:MYXO-CTERM domain-containing protein